MKKIFSLAVMLMATGVSYAQLEVDSYGRVNINEPINTPAKVNIEGTTFLFKGRRYGNQTQYNLNPAIEAQNDLSGPYWVTGIRGVSYGSDGATNCGIYGLCSEGGAYKNLGVMGCLYYTGVKGAGVYGTNHWNTLALTSFSKAYAGYFDGDVHVQGNVTYSGSITGNVLLSSAPAASSANTSLRNTPDAAETANCLSKLQLQTFYHEVPRNAEKKDRVESKFFGMDSLEIEAVKKGMAAAEEEERDVIGEQVLTKRHYGLEAEQLEGVFPDLVYENEDGSKSINYVEMVPILVQAINELRAEINELKGNGTVRKSSSRATKISDEMSDNAQISLGQNRPNPFTVSTSIEACIPSEVKTAVLNIYDLNGREIQQQDIEGRGKQTITISTSDLPEGIYLYSLIADGKVVETRRMIVDK